MLWVTMASAFNIISGFTGYMPFGYVAFYGIGAFATAIPDLEVRVAGLSIPAHGRGRRGWCSAFCSQRR